MSRTVKKPYTKSKAIDKICRNHGSCSYCKSNRTIRAQREDERVNLNNEIEHQIDASYDRMEAIYPEKLEALYKLGYYG